MSTQSQPRSSSASTRKRPLESGSAAAAKGINPNYKRRPADIDQDFETSHDKLGEGTYGVVKKAKEKTTGRKVAVKLVKLPKDDGEGISLTAIREIGLLKELRHDNIVTLRQVYADATERRLRLVYDLADYDLHRVVKHHHDQRIPIREEMIRSIMYQLFAGVAYLHKNWVIHRDLKSANVLIMGPGPEVRAARTAALTRLQMGVVKIADFGLARSSLAPLRAMHANVVTIWYRPPELLLGAANYAAPLDVWAVGCIFGELVVCAPLFQGTVRGERQFEDDQMKKIYELLGAIDEADWPEAPTLRHYITAKLWSAAPAWERRFGHCMPAYDAKLPLYQLLQHCLRYDPTRRITAQAALQHPYFQPPHTLSKNVFGSAAPPAGYVVRPSSSNRHN